MKSQAFFSLWPWLWVLATFHCSATAAHAVGTVVAWGSNNAGQTNVPPNLSNVVAVAGGATFSVALRSDGTVVAWGNTNITLSTPSNLTDVIAIAAGHSHALALRDNGTVVGWGLNNVGQLNMPLGLSGVTAIAAGNGHNLALRTNGTVVVWGRTAYGLTNVPGLSDVIAIGAGDNHNLVVQTDGSVVAWGNNINGQTSVPGGVSDVIAVDGGSIHSLALREDGVILAWGSHSGLTNPPPEATNVIAIAACNAENLALRADGYIVPWGSSTAPPSPLSNVVAIGVGHFHRLAVLGDDLPLILRHPASTNTFSGKSVALSVRARSHLPLTYQWRKEGQDISGATDATLTIQNAQTGDSGTYSVLVSDSRGSVLSAGAVLNVLDQGPVIIHEPANQFGSIGGSVTFQVVADGSLPLAYQWYFKGTNIPGANAASLVLTNLAGSNAGPYVVIVGNALGMATSVVATLTIGPPRFAGRLDTSFEPPGVDSVVRCLALDDAGRVLIGGYFGTVGGVSRPGVARLLNDGAVDTSFNTGAGTDGAVLGIARQEDGRILIGGAFGNVNGNVRRHVARLNSDGSLDATVFAPANASVWAVAIQPDGKILIGGDFTTVADQPRRGIARLNADGSLDLGFASGIETNGVVRAIAVQHDGSILVGGYFVAFGAGGVARANFAKLLPAGAVDLSFGANAGANGWIYAIALQDDGRILVGGSFSSYTLYSPGLARLTSSGDVDPTFETDSGPNGPVSAVAVQSDGRVLIGGGFTQINGVPQVRLGRLHDTGQVDTSFESSSGANDWVEAIALQPDGNIIIGGAFTYYDNQPRMHVARIVGPDPPPFAPYLLVPLPTERTAREGTHVSFTVYARGSPAPTYQWQHNGTDLPGATNITLTLLNIRMTNAGTYTVTVRNELGEVSGITTLTVLAAPTTPGSTDVNFYTGAGPNSTVNALAVQSDGKVLIGGTFTAVDNVVRIGVARLNGVGALDQSFVAALNNPVQALALQSDGRILVGGASSTVLRLLPGGGLDPTFTSAFSSNIGVRAMALLPDERLVVSTVNGQLSRLIPNGGLDLTFNATVVGPVFALAPQSDGTLLIGGSFSTVNGVSRLNLARLNVNGGVDLSFDTGTGINQPVHAIARWPDGRIVIAGDFTRVDGVPRSHVARLHADGSLDPTFDPGPGPNGTVNSLVFSGGRLIIGGAFRTVAGLQRGGVARLNGDGSVDGIFNPADGGASGIVNVVMPLSDALGRVLIGGSFLSVNGIPRPYVARLFGGAPGALAPVIVRDPFAGDVTAGQDVTFTVIASAVPAPEYQWYLDGMPIAGETNWLLTVHNVRSTNNGAYTVVVSNPHGSVTSTAAILAVDPAPLRPGAPDIDFYSGAGPNDRVTSIAVQPDGRIVIGGAFTEFDGLPRHRIARLERHGALDQTFDPELGANDIVHALITQPDGKLLIGGAFTQVNNMPRERIARLNTDGTVDTTFDPGLGPDREVLALALQGDGSVLVGGAFSMVGGVSRPLIARLTGGGALDQGFSSPWVLGAVTAIQPQNDATILVGGGMRGTNFVAFGCARLTASGELDPTFQPLTIDSSVNSIAIQNDDRIVLGGAFSIPRPRIARLYPTGGVDFAYANSLYPSDAVRAIRLQGDGRLIIGGNFKYLFAGSRLLLNRIARLTPGGLWDASFLPGMGVTNDRYVLDEYGRIDLDNYGQPIDTAAVYAIALEAQGRILIGGDFTHVNGISRPFIARLYDRPPLLTVRISAQNNSEAELVWEVGALQQAADLSGPWTDVSSATSPHRISLQGSLRFFRLRLN